MNLLQKVFDKIDQDWEEEVHFLQKLGKYPSTLGNEAAVQRFVEKKYREMGLEIDTFIPDAKQLVSTPGYGPHEWSYDGRPIVVGTWGAEGSKTGKSLILQGHIDVVSAEPLRLWDYDPWASTIEGDRMYGRGICDMKAGVAAYIYAVKAIKELGIKLNADLILQSVHEEEVTGNGAVAAIARGYKADACLIPEPFGPAAVTTQVGVLLFKVRVTGSGAHVLGADQAVNAIEKAMVLIEEMKRYRDDINAQPKPKAFEAFDHPLNVNIGVIQGGDWVSTVPADCMFEVRVGFYPDIDPQVMIDEITDRLMQAAAKDPWLSQMPPDITFYGHHAWGLDLDKDMDMFKVLGSAHKKVHENDMEKIAITATVDTAAYNINGIPATCYGPVGDNLHAPNEWVHLPSVKECTKVYAAFILEWCGVQNAEEVTMEDLTVDMY
ncbi:ArgE/DapE family deacylase [Pseudogracilibacillus auburnensis]|uniref:Acetylornithine deacetylase n=1 Tax=Pseudogracilibacillus auburnensis TaxID=1494959 RepID=A0A2V3VZX8_9BACI|nr:ArgE/DapE family deacylase [Pseudogracilibacillus auburnensis]MBO1002997.1 ArgE/DapE family deacylase [Pseudogracilibacillus auburnensis]PXW87096.1 acetylornithine deacetylase [Pseudogracilibacillus auburnensis]